MGDQVQAVGGMQVSMDNDIVTDIISDARHGSDTKGEGKQWGEYDCYIDIDASAETTLLSTSTPHIYTVPVNLGRRKAVHVLFSYISEDSEWVEETVEKLEREHGITCVFEDRDFIAGKPIFDDFATCTKQCQRTVLVLSTDYVNSGLCINEARMACADQLTDERKMVIPVIVKECRIPAFISHLTHLDVKDPTFVGQLVERIRSNVDNRNGKLIFREKMNKSVWSFFDAFDFNDIHNKLVESDIEISRSTTESVKRTLLTNGYLGHIGLDALKSSAFMWTYGVITLILFLILVMYSYFTQLFVFSEWVAAILVILQVVSQLTIMGYIDEISHCTTERVKMALQRKWYLHSSRRFVTLGAITMRLFLLILIFTCFNMLALFIECLAFILATLIVVVLHLRAMGYIHRISRCVTKQGKMVLQSKWYRHSSRRFTTLGAITMRFFLLLILLTYFNMTGIFNGFLESILANLIVVVLFLCAMGYIHPFSRCVTLQANMCIGYIGLDTDHPSWRCMTFGAIMLTFLLLFVIFTGCKMLYIFNECLAFILASGIVVGMHLCATKYVDWSAPKKVMLAIQYANALLIKHNVIMSFVAVDTKPECVDLEFIYFNAEDCIKEAEQYFMNKMQTEAPESIMSNGNYITDVQVLARKGISSATMTYVTCLATGNLPDPLFGPRHSPNGVCLCQLLSIIETKKLT